MHPPVLAMALTPRVAVLPTDSGALLGPREKVCSALVGSLVTSCLLTPVDALRIRLQVARTVTHPPAQCPLLFRMSDGLAGFLDAQGFEAYHCSCRTAVQLLEAPNSLQAMRVLIREEGWRSLYSALPITVCVTVPSVIIYYAGYDEARLYLKKRLPENEATVVSAAAARFVSTCLISPLEMVRTQTQAQSGQRRRWYSMIYHICRQSGPRALWKGLPPTLWRDVPFSMAYWLIYERSKAWMTRNKAQAPLWVSFASGACAGVVSSVLTHPFDVAKTRIQTALVRAPNHLPVHNSTWEVLRHIRHAEGVAGWFVGWQPRVARVAPACAIMIASYEACKWLFVTARQP